MKNKLGIKTGDVILMAVVLLSAVFMLVFPLFSSRSQYAEIVIAENNKTQQINLNNNATYKINSRDITLNICVKDGEVFVKDSNCRDSICRNTLPISRVGQSIVCAPAGVVIRIVGEGASVDGISG